MNATHAPGPWTIEEKGPSEAVQWKIRDATGRLVATGRTETRGDSVCPPDAYEYAAEVNARLIAAAPELLAACEDLLKSFGCTDWESVHDTARVQFAHDAIAKAKGVIR